MHEYDVALKLLLRASADSVLRQISIKNRVVRWLDVEFPKVQAPRGDLLGVTDEGELVHIELQSFNDPDMALRMAEYLLAIYRKFRKWPKQIVLYVGESRLKMKSSLRSAKAGPAAFAFQYLTLDVRDLETAALLDSEHVEDNVLAILTRLHDQKGAIRQILERIVSLDDPDRHTILAQFLIISGLRRLGKAIQEEAHNMPVLNDILSHDLLGPAILQGRQEGLQAGRMEMVRQLIVKRFGSLSPSMDARLTGLSSAELDDLAIRLLDASRLEDLFPSSGPASKTS